MAAGAAAAAIIAQAIKAAGVVVSVKPEQFLKILNRVKEPLVVTASGGVFSTSHKYLISYKGIAFYTKTSLELDLPAGVEVVKAGSIWIPG